jgi:hypothetical protein
MLVGGVETVISSVSGTALSHWQEKANGILDHERLYYKGVVGGLGWWCSSSEET